MTPNQSEQGRGDGARTLGVVMLATGAGGPQALCRFNPDITEPERHGVADKLEEIAKDLRDTKR
jgi:hypothetical protein